MHKKRAAPATAQKPARRRQLSLQKSAVPDAGSAHRARAIARRTKKTRSGLFFWRERRKDSVRKGRGVSQQTSVAGSTSHGLLQGRLKQRNKKCAADVTELRTIFV
jgi:phosphoribosylpyrophosphate synthetase